MKKSEWSDKDLEELLRQMPKVKDSRDPEDIYQNITIRMNKRKTRNWIMPSAAAACALLLFFILAPGLMPWDASEENAKQMADKSSGSNEIVMERSAIPEHKQDSFSAEQFQTKEPLDEKGNEKNQIMSVEAIDQTTAVYEEDTIGKEVLTYAIPDVDVQNLVPVSLVVSNDDKRSKFELFKEYMSAISEKDLGLSEYYPLNAKLMLDEENRILTVDVPADHSYSLSTTTERLLNKALANVMTTLDIKQINLMTDGKPGIEFSHYGYVDHFEPEDQPGNHAYYFYYTDQSNNSKPYIVPFGERQNSITEAFTEMKKDREEAKLAASIPEELSFETEENKKDKELTIRFEKGAAIDGNQSAIYTIEAILLTAKEFDYEFVKLENTNIDKIGRFDLNQELKVPVAANKFSLPQ